ncbi:hypothetical protein KUCAC02_021746 [Chaenocephalus aceratus]|uniref:Uncharacterized protein n=1 Tax=Chaenocephalus aceratus TaxID=36190 RepID=A0ACB9XH18_CHAAC|nr:hypothetical protein KUCAC02_021746 [Chaenocephalus aceratus]
MIPDSERLGPVLQDRFIPPGTTRQDKARERGVNKSRNAQTGLAWHVGQSVSEPLAEMWIYSDKTAGQAI